MIYSPPSRRSKKAVRRKHTSKISSQLPKISVLVLNYNGIKWLPTCLSSIGRTDYPKMDIYVVDNGSTDGSVEYVRENYPRVKLLFNKANVGFAEGYNRAIDKVKDKYVILLNSDTEVVNPRWINRLLDTAQRDPRIAAVACKMVSMEDYRRLDSVGGMGIPFWRGFVDIGREEYDQGQYDYTDFEPFAFCGGAALIGRDVFLKLGGFDEKFFILVEDVDLSWRMRLSGYRVAFTPEAKVAHYASGTFNVKGVDFRKLYYCHRNLLRTILKNCGSSLGWALRKFFLFSLIIAAGLSVVEPKMAISVVRAILWNLAILRDTYVQRLRIQSNRKTNEREILKKMYPRVFRYQPAERVWQRRILNILFEYSQMPLARAYMNNSLTG